MVPSLRGVLRSLATVLVSVAAFVSSARAAELGDVNGDSRISFADAYAYAQWTLTANPIFEPVAGSAEFGAHFQCTPQQYYEELLLFEALRRMGGARMPQFIERWPSEPADPPALQPESEDVVIEVLDTVHDTGEALVRLPIAVKTRVPIDGLSLVLDAEGVDLWPGVADSSDPLVQLPIEYLISGGQLIYHSRLGQPLRLPPGEVVFELGIELPRDTAAGRYEIAFYPGTEAILESGRVLRPRGIAGALTIVGDIATGNDLGFPPIDFADLEARRIGGSAEFRIVQSALQAAPGELLEVTVQARLNRPANFVPFFVNFDGTQLEVTHTEALFTDARFPVEFWGYYGNSSLWKPVPAGFGGRLSIADAIEARRLYEFHRTLSSIGYFTPIAEWVDLVRATLRVRDEAQNGDVDFRFDLPLVNFSWHESVFAPYAPEEGFLQRTAFANCPTTGAFWSYEPEVYYPASLTIVGGRPPGELPPPMSPEEAGISFGIGIADAQPGDVVVLPVRMRSLVELYILRLAVDFDEQRLEFLGAEVEVEEVIDEAQGVQVHSTFMTPEHFWLDTLNCFGDFPNRRCIAGFPLQGELSVGPKYEQPPGVVIIELLTSYLYGNGFYGGRLNWDTEVDQNILTLLFRVRPDAPPGDARVEGVEAEWRREGESRSSKVVSGGFPILDPTPKLRGDVPALAVETGVVRVGASGFTRGDANRDGGIDISDAVTILNALFLGLAPLRCPDAADTNDDGRNDVSDAVYLLNFRFLGGPQPPPPYPERGPDPSPDGLECVPAG